MSEVTPVHIEYTVTYQEWLEGRKAAAGRSRRNNLTIFWSILAVGMGVMVINLIRQSYLARQSPQAATAPSPQTPLWSIVLPLIPWVLVIGFGVFFIRRAVRHQWTRSRMAHRMFALDVDAQGVRLATGVEMTRWRWEAFTEFSETSDLTCGLNTNSPMNRSSPNSSLSGLFFLLTLVAI